MARLRTRRLPAPNGRLGTQHGTFQISMSLATSSFCGFSTHLEPLEFEPVTRSSAQLLLLWDVDGTLINNGGVSKAAYALGFELLTGKAPTKPVITDGMTDTAIMRSLFERHGLVLTPALTARTLEVLPNALASLVPQLRERGWAMPGARAALDAFAQDVTVLQSLLTGNNPQNALTKVATFGLHSGLDLEVGGYGSDSEVRAELVGAARRKASAKYGIEFTPSTTVLIGDTPRDVEAGGRWACPARSCPPSWSTALRRRRSGRRRVTSGRRVTGCSPRPPASRLIPVRTTRSGAGCSGQRRSAPPGCMTPATPQRRCSSC